MAWNEAAVTKIGLELLEKSILGGEIEITSAAGGERTCIKERLPQLTDIAPPRHSMEITEVKRLGYGVSVGVRLHNIGLRTGYCLRQIGLFGKIKDSGEAPVLLAVIQDSEGEAIPSETDNPEYLLEFGFAIPISNEANITAVLNSKSFATLDDLKNHTHSEMTGASEYLNGISGFVPKPLAGEQEKFLGADGTWRYVPKTHPFAVRQRDIGKTDYGYRGGGKIRLCINTENYTGKTEIGVVKADGTFLDADNLTMSEDTANHGDIIIKAM